MPFAATWMDLEIIILSEVSQTEKDKYHMISFICGIYNTSHHIYETKRDSQIQRTDLWLPWGRGDRGGKEWEWNGISRGKLLYIGWINSKVILYSTGNYIQYSVTNHHGKEHEKEYIFYTYYIYIYLFIYTHTHTHTYIQSHFAVQKKLTQHFKSTILQCNFLKTLWALEM